MKDEWAAAGIGKRFLFALAAAYWLWIAGSAVAAIVRGQTGVGPGFLIGTLASPLLLALAIRAVYAYFSTKKPAPRVWSWWTLVIGAGIGLLVAVQRAVVIMADRAA